jgi:hypothetical protein
MAKGELQAYELTKGGKFTRIEDGKPRTYSPGDTIHLTADEVRNSRALKGRLVPAGAVQLGAILGGVMVEPPTPKAAPSKPVSQAAVNQPRAASTAGRTDYSFLNDTDSTTIIDLINSIDDPDELDTLREAEMGKGGKQRLKVRNAVATRKRQLAMLRAHAAKKAKAAARELGEVAEQVGGAQSDAQVQENDYAGEGEAEIEASENETE